MNTKTQLSLVDQQQAVIRKVAGGEQQSIDEMRIQATMPRDEFDAEVTREKRIIKNTPLAGTAADREAARQRKADAESRLAAELPRIAAAIAEWQQRQSDLDRECREAAAEVDQQETAVEILRKNIPPHVARYRATSRRILKEQPQSVRMRELESRSKSIRNIAAIDVSMVDGREAAIRHAQSHDRSDVLIADQRNVVGGVATSYSLDIPAWGRYIAELRDELPAVEAEHNELRASYNAAMAEIDRVLDHYVPQ